jgi:hypothetical protein
MLNRSDCLEPNLRRAAAEVIDGEAIIIDLESGVYYSMPGIGGEIWTMIAARRSIDSMLEEILATYDVAADRALGHLEEVVGRLLAEGLVQVSGTEDSARVVARDAPRRPYTPPKLDAYRDMEDLLALDPPAPGMNQIFWNDGGPR